MRRYQIAFGTLALLAGFAAVTGPSRGQPVFPGGAKPAAPGQPALSDEDALKKAGLSPTDGPKLVAYLKQRTVTDVDQGKIRDLIARFRSDDFDERLKAAEELELYGPAAVPLLKAAERDPDAEVAYRAGQVLRKVDRVPHPAVAAAAVRAVVKLKPPGAAEALLGFLPLADSDAQADDIRGALVSLAVRDGKAEPALVTGLTDPSPVRRGAAYVALVEGGPAGERVRVKDAYPRVVEAVRKESDPDAKFRGLWSLVLTTREKEFVPDLIGTMPDLTRGRLWQLEDLLLQVAGSHPPGGRFGKTPDSVEKAKAAWLGWWAGKGGVVDLGKLDYQPRVRGYTDLVEADQSGFGRSRVVCLGPDMKEKWRLTGATLSPFDARVLPNGRVLVVEGTLAKVTERDPAGKVVRELQPGPSPVAAEGLPGGGVLAVCRGVVVEFDKDGKQVWSYPRPSSDIMSGRRLPNGGTVLVTSTADGPNCFRLDDKGREVGKPITLGRLNPHEIVGTDVVGGDRLLVCEADRVAEYELGSGKMLWKHAIARPTSAQRLPNGNTLIACLNQNRAVEVDPSGEEVWEYRSKDGPRVQRAYRR